MREVIVWETVHNALWQNLEKECYDSLCAKLVSHLEKRYEVLRKDRHPEDETIFVVTLYLFVDHKRHTFEFHVDDTMTGEHLFVLDVIHRCDE